MDMVEGEEEVEAEAEEVEEVADRLDLPGRKGPVANLDRLDLRGRQDRSANFRSSVHAIIRLETIGLRRDFGIGWPNNMDIST